jgi:hypothetical protein
MQDPKRYLLYEEQIKILMKDAYIEGISIGRNIIPKNMEIGYFFEEWYKDFIKLPGEQK